MNLATYNKTNNQMEIVYLYFSAVSVITSYNEQETIDIYDVIES